MNPSSGIRNRGAILIIVLVVVVMLSLSAYTFSSLMIAQHDAAKMSGRQVQSRAIVESGVEATRLFLAQSEEILLEAGGTYDNPPVFQGRLVVPDADPDYRGRFTVLAPAIDEDGNVAGLRYGLEDESTRLNLNALLAADAQAENGGRTLLMALPGMNEEIADAILDWIDPDDEPREFGAEIDYYSGLQPPYAPKNGPLDTVEELLLVKGIHEAPYLLFGSDPYRSGIPLGAAGANSPTGGAAAGGSAAGGADDASLGRGWSAYLTLYSKEKNVNSQGQPRVYLNEEDMQVLYDKLSQVVNDEWATFIVAYRQNGPYTGNDAGQSASGGKLDLTQPATTPLVQVLDLVGAKTSVTFDGDNQATVLSSPIQEESMALGMPTLMDNLTVTNSPFIPGRINISQAPRFVLEGIPGMEPDIVDAIISRRDIVPDDEDENRRFETWLVAEADPIVDLAKMRELMPFVCVGGDVYRAQVIGYYDGGGSQSRGEVILDATEPLPRILFWRDITHLPHGYPLEILGADLSAALE